MLNNIKWLMARKDPDKLLALYDESKSYRPQIIERLRELEAINELLEVAKKDPVHRSVILDTLLDDRLLDLNHFAFILSWLNLSMIHKRIIQYLKDNFPPEKLQTLIEHPNLDKVVKRNLKKQAGLDKKEKDLTELNEDYLKIRMLLEEVELDGDIDEMSESRDGEISSEMDRIKRYMNIRKRLTAREELELIEREMKWWVQQDSFHLSFLLSLINLSRLSPQDKVDLIRRIDSPELFFPENFQFISENAELPFETFQALFSLTTLSEWIKTFLTTHYAVELFSLFKHYDQFNWLENYLHSLSIIHNIDLVSFNDRYYLTGKYGYRLHELIPDETILRRLVVSCRNIHELIVTNIHVDNFPLEHFMKPLLLVGGCENFAFIAKLMMRRVVDNPQAAISEIEQNYLQLKQRIDSPEDLKQLIGDEIVEKNSLISQDKYNTITNMYFESITSANYLQPRVIEILKENLPDIEKFSVSATTQGKVLLCKYIALLGLEQYRQILEEYTGDEDYRIAIHAAIALHSLGDPVVNSLLHRFVQSPNYMVRKLVASSLQLLSNQLDESLILKLAQDKHPEVCREAIQTISRLPLAVALDLFAKITPVTYYKNRPYIAEALGELGSDLVLPLLAELIKKGDADDYRAVIRAVGEVNSKVAATMLHHLELQKNPVLEIERARSLIRLGDFSGWRTLENYFDFSLGYVRDLAKMTFLQLAAGDRQSQLWELSNDPSPIVSALAAGKMFLYDEQEGWAAITRLKNSGDGDKQFHLTQLLGYLPYKKVKETLRELETAGYGCRTLVAIIYADHGNPKLLVDIERNIFNISQYEHRQIVRAIRERPNRHCLAIIKKLALMNDAEILDDVLGLLLQYDNDEAMKVVQSLWIKSDELGHISLARLLGSLRSHDIITFAQKHMENATLPVKAELAYTLIVQGDESGWNVLLQIMSDSNPAIMKIPIPILARLRSNEALDVLVRQLVTPSESIQAELIKAIGGMQLQESLPILKKYVMNHSNKIKIAVAKALSEMDTTESREMLAMLASDHDEYVRVAVDIAKQKQTKGLEMEREGASEVFKALFRFTDWRLPPLWFAKLAKSFRKDFESYRPQPIESFANRKILDIEELDRRRGRIQDELNEKLIGCSDVDAILEAKREAQEMVDGMATREELIRSILEEREDDYTDEQFDIFIQAVDSGDEEIIKAIIIVSAESTHEGWLRVLDHIASFPQLLHLSDLLIYSLKSKLHGGALPVFMRLLDNERAHYYLNYLFNYFVIHPENLEIDHLKHAKQTLKEQHDVPKHLVEAANQLLNILVEHAI